MNRLEINLQNRLILNLSMFSRYNNVLESIKDNHNIKKLQENIKRIQNQPDRCL